MRIKTNLNSAFECTLSPIGNNLHSKMWSLTLFDLRSLTAIAFSIVPYPHYDNKPIQYTAIFHGCKNDYFQMKNCDDFLIFAQNIDCGYTLEKPQRGGSNEYPQSMF